MSSEMTDGIPQKEWNKILEKYVEGTGFEAERYEEMSPNQRFMIKELDKLFARLDNRNEP